ncbi:MAG TPA: lytic murein transglycosylase [Solirubrobacteraceae bacterium]|nr:lytic murein transglycosylase [Solirubrobacteraceae bacterium]
MTRRILAIGVAVAAMLAAVLGPAAPAQAPTPDPTEQATPEPITSPAPTATVQQQQQQQQAPATPTATATAPATPTASPTQTATSTPTSTATATPTATATAPATPTATPTATATPENKPRKRRKKNSNAGEGQVVKCGNLVLSGSLSTSARECEAAREEAHKPVVHAPILTNPDGSPAPTNPGYSVATIGPARVGVPNFFIDKFRIPPFLLPIYQAAGMQYGVRWEILAAINEIETDYGRNLNISSAGAVGWMQFMPATWEMYGVDANGDGIKDPFNPVDAIFAAARYLKAAGADSDIRRAVFAYNHADWYVDSVLMRAQVIGGLPSDLVGSLTGLTQGRFPVHAKATYAGQLTKKGNEVKTGNAAMVVESDEARRGIDIFSREGAPIITVNDGKIVKVGKSKRLGKFVMVQDVYGNTYTYGHLGDVEKTYPAPKDRSRRDGKGRTEHESAKTKDAPEKTVADEPATEAPETATATAMPTKERLFAHPNRPAARAAGGESQIAPTTDELTQDAPLGFKPRDFEPKPLKKGARIIGGTIIGHLGKGTEAVAPHLRFEIRPAGSGAPRIDPKPILDGWKLLESTAVYRAKGKNPFFGADAENPSIGQLLLLSKEQLIQRVLHDERIQIYGCGVADVRSGQIDRRPLATLLYLAGNGLKPTVTSFKCGHGYLTSSGNVSEHSTGTAMDIGAINGIVIRPATQGPGSITDVTIQALLKLQGTMKPHQIISLMTFEGTDNTLSMSDHDDHIHVGWRPLYGENRRAARQINAVLKPEQWIKLIDRLGSIDNPTVREQPSRFAVKVRKPASQAHRGE